MTHSGQVSVGGYSRLDTRTQTHTHIHTHTHTHTHTHSCTHTQACAHVRKHTHTHAHTLAHTCVHTHPDSGLRCRWSEGVCSRLHYPCQTSELHPRKTHTHTHPRTASTQTLHHSRSPDSSRYMGGGGGGSQRGEVYAETWKGRSRLARGKCHGSRT